MKSWKTTVGGLMTAAGLSMQASPDKTVQVIGWVVAAIGSAVVGVSAKDSNVTGGTNPSTPEAEQRVTK